MSDLNLIAKQFLYEYDAPRPTLKTWLKHFFFLLLTLFTTTIAGTLYPFGLIETLPTDAEPETWAEIAVFIISLPGRYYQLIFGAILTLATDLRYLQYGLSFSLSLLFILISHEAGHYVACRLYRVEATLPYFVPTPPLIGPAGTFGAFIKILSPLPSRRAIFDIGVAGPIAGFLALIPIAVIGFLTLHPAGGVSTDLPPGTLIFSEPLLFRLLARACGTNLQAAMSPNAFYSAAWVGLLVTALNLIPAGQLDGGHAVYSIFGVKIHRLTGIAAFVAMVALSISGWFLYNSPSGFLFTIILGVMLWVRHPQPYDETPLDFKRKVVAFVTLLIFVLSFSPFPIQIT